MNVQMVSKEFSLSPSLREHIIRRLDAAFARTHHKVGRIVIRLRDLNGPRGGRDKVCQVDVELANRPGVVIREVQENMYNAIDNAVRRAAYRAMRLASRQPRPKLSMKAAHLDVIGQSTDKSHHD